MSKASKLLEEMDTAMACDTWESPVDPLQNFRYFCNEVLDGLEKASHTLQAAELPASDAYHDLLKELAAKSQEILNKVADFIDKSKAKTVQEPKPE